MTDYEQFKKWIAVTAIADAWWTNTLGEKKYKKWLRRAKAEIERNLLEIEAELNEKRKSS